MDLGARSGWCRCCSRPLLSHWLLPQKRAGGSTWLRGQLPRLEHVLGHPCRQASCWSQPCRDSPGAPQLQGPPQHAHAGTTHSPAMPQGRALCHSGPVSPTTAGCSTPWQEAACPAWVRWAPAPRTPGASFAKETRNAFRHASSPSPPVAPLPQLLSALPQPCPPGPAWPPRANPASPWGAAEGGGNPGGHQPEGEGDLGKGMGSGTQDIPTDPWSQGGL